MANLLLINNQTIIIIVACAGGAIVLGAMIYGAFRKFTEQTWIGWQVPAVFGLTFLLRYIPLQASATVNFIIWAGGFTAAVALVLGLGGIVRWAIYRRKFQAAVGWRVLDRILGLITAPLTIVVLIVVLGGYVLSAIEVFSPSLLGPVFTMPIWTQFFGLYAVDLFMCAIFVLLMRAGYRMGIFRLLYTVIMLGLSGGSVAGAILFTTKVGFMRKFAGAVAGLFGKINPSIATVVGYGSVILLCFIVFFVISMVLGHFLHKLVKKLCSFRVLGVVTGIVVGILFSAVFLAAVCGINAGVAYLVSGKLASLPEPINGVAGTLESIGMRLLAWIGSSPLSSILYLFNPLRALAGG